jgi:hypothetical protein
VYVGKEGDRVGLAVAPAQAERQSIARGDKDSTRSDEATSESESISGGAAPTSTPLDALIEKWRSEQMGPEGRVYIDIKRCADELEKLLAASPASALTRRDGERKT